MWTQMKLDSKENVKDNQAHVVDNDCGRYALRSVQQQVKSRRGTSDIDDVITNLYDSCRQR